MNIKRTYYVSVYFKDGELLFQTEEFEFENDAIKAYLAISKSFSREYDVVGTEKQAGETNSLHVEMNDEWSE